jgi:hypothetical protein
MDDYTTLTLRVARALLMCVAAATVFATSFNAYPLTFA